MNWTNAIIEHYRKSPTYSLRDFQNHFATKQDAEEFATVLRRNQDTPIKTFMQTANDWQAMVAPAVMATISQYGLVDSLPENLIMTVGEERDSVIKRFVWKSEPIEDYSEGESFNETYMEGATTVIRWRKPGAKILQTREAGLDLPLSVMQMNAQLTVNEFKAREWKHFTHELHNATSNAFDTRAQLKDGTTWDMRWRDTFDNAYDGDTTDPYTDATYPTWRDIRTARAKMLRRERDAVRPTVCVINASTEAALSDSVNVNNAAFLGNADTFFRTGTLPNVYQLTFIVVPDAFMGYFTNNVTRKNATFRPTNDAFLIATDNGPTMLRHTRESLSTQTWQIYDGQKEAMNLWERYEYSVFRHTNIMRIAKELDGSAGPLN